MRKLWIRFVAPSNKIGDILALLTDAKVSDLGFGIEEELPFHKNAKSQVKTVAAKTEVKKGGSKRGGNPVERRLKSQAIFSLVRETYGDGPIHKDQLKEIYLANGMSPNNFNSWTIYQVSSKRLKKSKAKGIFTLGEIQ